MEPNTVTLSLETYEAMKSELQHLRQQVQEKTIVKHIIPEPLTWVIYAVMIVGAGIIISKL